jgi:hypothetical protein
VDENLRRLLHYRFIFRLVMIAVVEEEVTRARGLKRMATVREFPPIRYEGNIAMVVTFTKLRSPREDWKFKVYVN